VLYLKLELILKAVLSGIAMAKHQSITESSIMDFFHVSVTPTSDHSRMIGVTRSGAALPTIMIATINFASTPALNMMRGRETNIETGLLHLFLKLMVFTSLPSFKVLRSTAMLSCVFVLKRK
jgi:hypothetical protein